MRNFVLPKLLRRRVLVALVLVTGILGATVVYAQAAKVTTTYRTALVTYGTITQSIGMAGNLAAAEEADLNFASSGTVETVYVSVGQAVGAGTPLATLDTSLLSAQLLQAQATLASAESKLAQDEAGPSASSLTSAENQVSAAAVAVSNAQTSLADTKAINAQAVAAAQAAAQAAIDAAQAAVNADQAVVNLDNTQVAADTTAMNLACPPVGTAGPACDTATALVTADKAKQAADQQTLSNAKAGLTSAEAPVEAATVKAQQSNDQAAASLASTQQQYSAAKSSLAAVETSTSPQTIQMDDAQIEIDQVNVNSLQHQVNGAVITSPIPGIVSQVNVKAGQAFSNGGSTYAVVVFSPTSYDVTGTVSDSQINLIAVGQQAEVTPAGSTQALLGKITTIAPAATVSSGVATFAVTAQLTDTSNSIKPGISATVSIVVNQVVHVLTVPTSAVHTTAAGSTVLILVNGKPQSVAVQTGASDPTRIEIVSGLQLNQVVVIAIVTSSVPSSGGTGTSVLGGGGRGTGGGFRGGGG
jgi:multidrug efflux pump subunit AcrA (membrane-fusion protein)